MDTQFIFEQVQKMRPSSFSEEERHRYEAEKMMLRQFLLMKQQHQVSDHLTIRNMKTWLLTATSFLKQFQEIIQRTGIDNLFMAELAWTTARHFCLNQMEQELLETLDEEKRLSQLFRRKVTLDGLQMFVSAVRPGAEEDVRTLLPPLHRKLLRIFGGILITSSPLPAGDATPAELLELEQSTAPLVPEVVDTALKFLLEEPEQTPDRTEAASAEIGKLLTDSVVPCLSQFGSVSKTLMLGVITIAARSMFKAICRRFDERSESFHQMDYDQSFFSARDAVISAIQDMDPKSKTPASSQAHHRPSTSEGPEEGLPEKRESSLEAASSEQLEEGLVETTETRVSLDEERATRPGDETEDKPDTSVDMKDSDKEQSLVQDSATSLVSLESSLVLNMDEEPQQENMEASETQEALVQDPDVKEKKNKKKRVRAFFCGVWKKITSCFHVSTED